MSFQRSKSDYLHHLLNLGASLEKIELCYKLDLHGKLGKNIKMLINRIEFLNKQLNGLSNIEYSIYGNKMNQTLSRLILQFNSINDKIIV